MTVIITDEDVARHLSMRECIDSMATAFTDFSSGDAVNLPRVRYQARHSDPTRRYFANVHVGAVPSAGIACVRAVSKYLDQRHQVLHDIADEGKRRAEQDLQDDAKGNKD